MRYPDLYHEEDTGQPHGGEVEGKQRPPDVLDRYGRDALKLAEKLAEALTDNYTLREQRRGLRAEVADLKSKTAPEGARVLTKDEAAVYDAYAALGKKPDELKQAIDLNGEATTELARLKREQLLGKAAAASGFKPSVLQTLAGDLPIELRDVDGKPAAFVEGKPLAEYAGTAWADFLPALTVQTGTGYVAQSTGDKPPAQGDKAAQHIAAQEERRKAQPNPLMKPQGA
jgi:hypothetical protein